MNWLIDPARRLAAVFLLAAPFAAPLAARAADSIVVGVEEINYLPHYQFMDGELHGFAADLIQQFARDRNYRVDYRSMSIPRLYGELLDGAIDLKYPDDPDWATTVKVDRDIFYSAPVVGYVDGVSVLPARLGRGVETIRTLGIVTGFTPQEWEGLIARKRVVLRTNRSLEALIKLAIDGQVDGVYGNVAVMAHVAKDRLKQPAALTFDPALPHAAGSYYFSTSKRPKLVAEIDAWMAENRDWIKELKRQHQLER